MTSRQRREKLHALRAKRRQLSEAIDALTDLLAMRGYSLEAASRKPPDSTAYYSRPMSYRVRSPRTAGLKVKKR